MSEQKIRLFENKKSFIDKIKSLVFWENDLNKVWLKQKQISANGVRKINLIQKKFLYSIDICFCL